MRRAGHKMDFDAARPSANETLDDDGVLVALVLDEQRMSRLVDELRDSFAPVGRAPDQVCAQAGFEFLAVPVGVKTRNDLFDTVGVGSGDGIVAGLGQV